MARKKAKSEVATTETHPAAELLSGLRNLVDIGKSQQSAVGAFMTYKKGTYVFGVDKLEVEEDSEWAVNPLSMIQGWQCWEGQECHEVVVGMNAPAPLESGLEIYTYRDKKLKADVTAEWKPLRGFQLVCLTGEDEGEQCLLSGASYGFRKATQELLEEIHTAAEKDVEYCVAVIRLETDSYEHTSHGEIQFPVFEIVGWESLEATQEAFAKSDEEDEAEPEYEGEGEDEAEEEEFEEVEKGGLASRRGRRGVSREEEADLDAADKPARKGRAAKKEKADKPAKRGSRKKAAAKAKFAKGGDSPPRRRQRRG